MIEIKYVCSNGEEYNLIGEKMRATSGYFHAYEWKPNTTEREMGVTVNAFAKEPVTYDITLTVRGKEKERKQILNKLTNAFEYDVVNLTPGRIYYGEYYIDGYVKKSSNEVSSENNSRTDCKIEIYCPYPFWSMEQQESFYPDSANKGKPYTFLDYPIKYNYDYSRKSAGTQNWIIDHFRDNNFEMAIYGPCADPRILINGYPYQIYETLEAGEYILIASREKTITKHLRNGTVQNIFAKRAKDKSVFALIPSGVLTINWSGEFGFDIKVYKERSVPEWNWSIRIR